jgi:hypothetical protein
MFEEVARFIERLIMSDEELNSSLRFLSAKRTIPD